MSPAPSTPGRRDEPRRHGPWTIHGTRRHYRNEFMEVLEDAVVQPDGKPGSYATVRLKPGVSILPIADDGTVTLIRQFRYALGRDSLETVSGAREANESPLAAAQREAREEAGIEADEWTDLGSVDLDTSIVNCEARLFLARGLRTTATDRDSTERVEAVRLPLGEAVERVLRAEITHGPSCALILKAAWLLGTVNPPEC